jgi:hypothetical protein
MSLSTWPTANFYALAYQYFVNLHCYWEMKISILELLIGSLKDLWEYVQYIVRWIHCVWKPCWMKDISLLMSLINSEYEEVTCFGNRCFIRNLHIFNAFEDTGIMAGGIYVSLFQGLTTQRWPRLPPYGFLDRTQLDTRSVGRCPLDEGSASRKDMLRVSKALIQPFSIQNKLKCDIFCCVEWAGLWRDVTLPAVLWYFTFRNDVRLDIWRIFRYISVNH